MSRSTCLKTVWVYYYLTLTSARCVSCPLSRNFRGLIHKHIYIYRDPGSLVNDEHFTRSEYHIRNTRIVYYYCMTTTYVIACNFTLIYICVCVCVYNTRTRVYMCEEQDRQGVIVATTEMSDYNLRCSLGSHAMSNPLEPP